MVDVKDQTVNDEKNELANIEIENEENEKKDDEKIDLATIKEEDLEEEIIDAENTWGNEDPSEIEVEAFCLPTTSAILEDICEHIKRRRLCVFPLKITELNHPAIIEAIDKSIDFKTSYVKIHKEDGNDLWNGIIEMTFKTGYLATDAAEFLKTIREDIQVKIVNENTKKLSEHWIADSEVEVPRSVGHLLCVKRINADINHNHLKNIFTTSSEILITRPNIGSRIAYVFFDTHQQMLEAYEKHSKEDVIVNNVKLKVMKHQHPQLPSGLLKMKRRFKVLLQIHELKKALKDKDGKLTDATKTKINTTIESCNMTIEKDDKIREGLNMKLWTFKELRSIKPLRESDVMDSIWLPNKATEGAEEDEYERLKRVGSKSGVPSLLEMPITPGPPFPPIARVQEIAAHLAHIQRTPVNQPSRGGGGGSSGGSGGNRPWTNNRNQSRDNYPNRQNNKRGRSPPKDEPGPKMNRDERKPESRWTPKPNHLRNDRNQQSHYSSNNKSNYNQPLQQHQQHSQQQGGGNYSNQNQNFNQGSASMAYQQPTYQSQTNFNSSGAQQQQQPGYDASSYMQQSQTYGFDYAAYNQQSGYAYNYNQQPAAGSTAANNSFAASNMDQTQQQAVAAAAWSAAQQQSWPQNQWGSTSDPSQTVNTAATDHSAGANYSSYNWTPANNWSAGNK